MYPTHQLSGLRFQVSGFLTALVIICAVTGCATLDPAAHLAKVDRLRAITPYVTRIGNTHSMATVVRAGGTAMVRPQPYARLQPGQIAVYWPIASPTPVAHFVKGRIGTDSWETAGMNQPGDIALFGYLLTRENYIGVIY